MKPHVSRQHVGAGETPLANVAHVSFAPAVSGSRLVPGDHNHVWSLKQSLFANRGGANHTLLGD